MKKSVFFAATLATLLCSLGACSGQKAQEEKNHTPPPAPPTQTTAPSPTANANRIVVATEANFVPMRYLDNDQKPIGFQIDILREMAKAEGLNVDFVLTPKAKRLDYLANTTDYNVVLGTFDATPENKALADFTDPLMTTRYVVYMKSDKDGDGSVADLKDKKIGIDGYYAQNAELVKALTLATGNPENVMITPPKQFIVWNNMAAGKADGAFGENLILDYIYKTHGKQVNFKLKKINLELPENHRALLVKKGNDALVERLNKGLAKIKENGTYDTLYQKWFGKN